ncbi:cytochrome P450 82A3-like [Hibiscus syriacus]|uniref:Cytochrome P450 82A3-like n=1 Tax=Hibiscus syriacus TaxID=106335 RepID=A0A6A2YAI7_HIBSY|nr:cytochrome P450 82A3-like [Hibiscus syriacus]
MSTTTINATRPKTLFKSLGGYEIPKGTRLIINLHKIQRDLELWPEPFEFFPERFLTTHKDVDVRGQHFELMPFGSGRRSFPDTSFALQMLHLTLSNFLHAFEFSRPGNDDRLDRHSWIDRHEIYSARDSSLSTTCSPALCMSHESSCDFALSDSRLPQQLMKAILRKDGCLTTISERPVNFTDDNKWIEMDENAMANFHLALADEVLSSIEEEKTSKEI